MTDNDSQPTYMFLVAANVLLDSSDTEADVSPTRKWLMRAVAMYVAAGLMMGLLVVGSAIQLSCMSGWFTQEYLDLGKQQVMR